MEWTDDAIVLAARPHGEGSAVVSVLTRARGRQAGLVRGGAGHRQRGILQPGNRVVAQWRARLPEHLGTMTCEPVAGGARAVLGDPDALAALAAACAVAEATLPEREPHGPVYDGLDILLGTLADGAVWPTVYVKWELGLIAELGFGLDLEACAATGRNDQLAYVSPRTGRAVSLAAGEPYRDRLLPLPGFLVRDGAVGIASEIAQGLALTGYFLERHVLAAHHRGMPAARVRLANRFAPDPSD